MPRLLASIIALSIVLAPSPTRADSDEPRVPCACSGLRFGRARTTALVLGISLLGTGYVLSAAHAITLANDLHGRVVELVPIGGAIDALARDGLSTPWTGAMMYSAWSQAMGVLVLSLALSPRENH